MEYDLIKIPYFNLVDCRELDYDIYDAQGKLFSKKGETLDAGKLLQLKFITVYKKEPKIQQDNSSDQDNKDDEIQKVTDFTRELLLLALKKQAVEIDIEPNDNDLNIFLHYEDKSQEKIGLQKNIYEPLTKSLKKMVNKFSRFLDIDEKSLPGLNNPIKFEFNLSNCDYGEKISLRLVKTDENKISGLESSDLLIKNKFFEINSGIFLIVESKDIKENEVIYSILKHANDKGLKTGLVEQKAKYCFQNTGQFDLYYIENSNSKEFFNNLSSQKFNFLFFKDLNINDYKIELIKLSKTCPVIIYLNNNSLENAKNVLYEFSSEGIFSDFNSYLAGILVQKRLQKICTVCREKYELSEDEINKIFEWDGKTKVFAYRVKGCDKCNNTRYLQTVPAQEFILVNNEIRELLQNFNFKEKLEEYFEKINYKDLNYNALKNVLKGIIAIEEFEKLS